MWWYEKKGKSGSQARIAEKCDISTLFGHKTSGEHRHQPAGISQNIPSAQRVHSMQLFLEGFH